jgi:hypothetical protein
LGTVSRTRPFAVTAIGAEPFCLLRAIFESERSPRPISAGPEAALGSLIHEALKLHGRDGADKVAMFLRAALADERGTIASAATLSGRIRLRDAIPATRISARLRLARSSAASARALASQPSDLNPRRSDSSGHPSRRGTYRELPLRSEEFELAGQPDYLSVAETCVIVDYKTGSILDSDGQVKTRFLNQLLLYGMLASECGYGSNFELVLTGSDFTHKVRFDRGSCAGLEQRLEASTQLAPLGHTVDHALLANVGAACMYCNFRSACDPYKTAAPGLWTSAPTAWKLPADTWGIVREVFIDALGDDYAAVHLVDAADRFVAVTGIPKRLLDAAVTRGTSLAVYGAYSHKSGPLHPLNFAIAVPGNPIFSRHAALVTCSAR